MEDEKKIETPEEKVETAVPLEKEDIYGNDEFVDAKKPAPVVEERTGTRTRAGRRTGTSAGR